MAHPGGRPTDYNPDTNYINLADEYLKTCGREQTKLPKLLEFYEKLDISAETADTWKDKYPQFLDACKKISAHQQNELIDDGLFGGKEVNPGMAIFLLKVNHGMIETERKEFMGKGGAPLSFMIEGVSGKKDAEDPTA